MEKLIRRINLAKTRGENARVLLRREWLLTNGLGGYASGTISGSVSWRYHGYLIAALPAPLGRMVMLNHLAEFAHLPDGRVVQFGGEEPSHPEESVQPSHYVVEFRLENQLPIWRYEVEGFVIEKRVLLVHGQNTVHVNYSLLSGTDGLRLQICPSVHFRPHEHPVGEPLSDEDYGFTIFGDRYEISGGEHLPRLRLLFLGGRGTFTHDGGRKREIFYSKEADRGYESRGLLWSPGHFDADLSQHEDATIIASTETWNVAQTLNAQDALSADQERRRRLLAIAPSTVQSSPRAELIMAADQFIIKPAGRIEDSARARAAGDEIRTVIAGYHWFTDWGRDTMISLEGLTLSTGRHAEAGWILRTFAQYIRSGLIPNLFPEGKNQGLYHTADATPTHPQDGRLAPAEVLGGPPAPVRAGLGGPGVRERRNRHARSDPHWLSLSHPAPGPHSQRRPAAG